MNILLFFLQSILFIFSILLCFYLPGRFLVKRLGFLLSSLEDIFFTTVFGMMIFTLLAYFLLWIKLGNILIFVIVVVAIIVIKNREWQTFSFKKQDRFPLLIISVFALLFSFIMIFSGDFGNVIRLIGSNKGDSVWHLSLINELKVHFPPDYPGTSGIPLRGYHFLYDFLLAQLSNIFTFSPTYLYFQFFPMLLAILWALGVYVFILKWSKNRITALWATFFTMFGGSFSYILFFQGHKGYSFDDAFGMTQPVSSLVNPPLAISIVFIIATLFAYCQYFATKKIAWLFPITIFTGPIALFKVYAGIVLMSGLVFASFLEILKKRFFIVGALIVAGILFITTYWVFSGNAGTLVYAPLWAPHKVLQDHFPWYGYDEKIYTYTKLSVIKGIVETEAYALYVFIIGSLGTRVFGFLTLCIIPIINVRKRKPVFSPFLSILLFMTAVSLFIPLFFIQSVKVFEIIQLTWYFLFFTSLFASFGFSFLFHLRYPRFIKILFFIIIMVLTLPSAYEKFITYLSFNPASTSYYKGAYLESLRFLSVNGKYDNVVIEVPGKEFSPEIREIQRWYGLSTPRLIAFSNKRGYLENQYIDFKGVNLDDRIQLLQKILFFEKNPQKTYLQNDIERQLIAAKIVFIYSPNQVDSLLSIKNIHKIFQNQAASIYKFNGNQK